MKYSFYAIFKGLGKGNKANIFYAPSSTKAHKKRSRLAKSENVIFVSGIKKTHPSMPLLITMQDLPTIRDFEDSKHAREEY